VVRLVGQHVGPVSKRSAALDADASLENHPAVLFDGAIVADGEAGIAALASDGRSLEFLRDIYRHGKTLMALGVGERLLTDAGIDIETPDPGLLVAAKTSRTQV